MGNIWITSWNHCDMAGKAIMVMLVMLSFYSWYILIEKFIFLRDSEKKNRLFEKFLMKGEPLRSPDCPLSSILEYGMELKRKTGSDYLDGYLEKAFLQEQGKLEKKIASLATVATIAPFLGLLGTVWGLLLSFLGIVAAGASSVRVVAAGVSEALITTVAGLAVAIPASIGYNYYRDRIFKILDRMECLFPYILNYLKNSD
ncbi:MAG TPA: MotA/TolQ/ExbB proton channel family protein [bacterium]|nr:MotA/TolQ/ExbB proton channel family protein [bacterium]